MVAVIIDFYGRGQMYWDMAQSFSVFPTNSPVGDFVSYLALDTLSYFEMGLLVPAWLVVWRRWRQPLTSAWGIEELDRRAFSWNLCAVCALLTVAIPTLSAFSFVAWLGPWWVPKI
jgi:hypothetical protein